ncbi:universal stress protein [Pacificoceanicola onchidii]|uniref:universal stress protein n=1 Tax=Pacificoceanicola onchidii TaxID=2562685 RepID=UPI0010A3B64F|nr:universal stress protein [Pacificoceanicola onchidii]
MFEKILLAVDLNQSKGKRRTLDAACQLAQVNNAELHVLNVVPDSGMAMVGAALGPELAQKILDEAEAQLKSWAAENLPDGAAADLHVAKGNIYDTIIRTANEIGADAIVVGAHRPELRDYLVGPNAARVVRHANQSVFVIR